VSVKVGFSLDFRRTGWVIEQILDSQQFKLDFSELILPLRDHGGKIQSFSNYFSSDTCHYECRVGNLFINVIGAQQARKFITGAVPFVSDHFETKDCN